MFECLEVCVGNGGTAVQYIAIKRSSSNVVSLFILFFLETVIAMQRQICSYRKGCSLRACPHPCTVTEDTPFQNQTGIEKRNEVKRK